MNCREFLNEFEDRNALTDAATLHLKDCADCQKLNVIQARVWQLIDRFEPVDVPNDFDFRVKARIASAQPSAFQPQTFPVLRYVLGLSIAGLILAFVVFNGFYSFNDKTVPSIANNNFQPAIQKEDYPTNPFPSEQIAETVVPQSLEGKESVFKTLKPRNEQAETKKQSRTSKKGTQFVADNSTKNLQERAGKDNDKNFVGSQDRAVSTPRIFMPKGIPNSLQTSENSSNFEQTSSQTAEQILLLLGIEIASVNGRRQVKTVKQNSVAERSDVKVGDWVEAIDGEKLTDKALQNKTIQGKKLTVVRGAEKIEISLHN